jgi:hypothetical protein
MRAGLEIQASMAKNHCPDCNMPSWDDGGCVLYQMRHELKRRSNVIDRQAEELKAKDKNLHEECAASATTIRLLQEQLNELCEQALKGTEGE